MLGHLHGQQWPNLGPIYMRTCMPKAGIKGINKQWHPTEYCGMSLLIHQGWGKYWTYEYNFWKISTRVVLKFKVFSVFMFITLGRTSIRVVLSPTLITVTPQWVQWHLKSPVSRLFTQLFIQAQIKENVKAPHHWPLCGELTGDQLIPCTKGQ